MESYIKFRHNDMPVTAQYIQHAIVLNRMSTNSLILTFSIGPETKIILGRELLHPF